MSVWTTVPTLRTVPSTVRPSVSSTVTGSSCLATPALPVSSCTATICSAPVTSITWVWAPPLSPTVAFRVATRTEAAAKATSVGSTRPVCSSPRAFCHRFTAAAVAVV